MLIFQGVTPDGHWHPFFRGADPSLLPFSDSPLELECSWLVVEFQLSWFLYESKWVGSSSPSFGVKNSKKISNHHLDEEEEKNTSLTRSF